MCKVTAVQVKEAAVAPLTFFFEEVLGYSRSDEWDLLSLDDSSFFLIIFIKFIYQEISNSLLCLNNIQDLP